MLAIPLAAMLLVHSYPDPPLLGSMDTIWLVQGGGFGWIKPRRKGPLRDGCLPVEDRRVPLHQEFGNIDTLVGPFEICTDTGSLQGLGVVHDVEFLPGRTGWLHHVRHRQGIRLRLDGKEIRAEGTVEGAFETSGREAPVPGRWKNPSFWTAGAIQSGISESATNVELEWDRLRFQLVCPPGLEVGTVLRLGDSRRFFDDDSRFFYHETFPRYRFPVGAKLVRLPGSPADDTTRTEWLDREGKPLTVSDTFEIGRADTARPALRWMSIRVELDLGERWMEVQGRHPPGEAILSSPSSGHRVPSGGTIVDPWSDRWGSVPGELESTDLGSGWLQESDGLKTSANPWNGGFLGWKPESVRWRWRNQTFRTTGTVSRNHSGSEDDFAAKERVFCYDGGLADTGCCSVAWGLGPLDHKPGLRWRADPPLWDTAAELVVDGFGSGRLEPWFTWVGDDSIRVQARIRLDSGWARTFGTRPLAMDFQFPLRRDTASGTRVAAIAPIRDFFIPCLPNGACHLPDSSRISRSRTRLGWLSDRSGGELALVPSPRPVPDAAEGSVRATDPIPEAPGRTAFGSDIAWWQDGNRFLPLRRARATARGLFLDTTVGASAISRSKTGLTFTIADVAPDTSRIGLQEENRILDKFRTVAEMGTGAPREYSKQGFGPIQGRGFDVVSRELGEHGLVDIEGNGFVQAFVRAWDGHRPVGFSPDAVWMLLVDGLALSVEADPETWRHRLGITHRGKSKLGVLLSPTEASRLGTPPVWRSIAQRLVSAMGRSTGGLDTLLVPEFSTTTPMRRAAFRFRALEVVKPYFDYVGTVSCGIPSVTIQGTPEDWSRLREGARALGRLGLSDWTDSLEPLLSEFVAASEGHPDLSFWKSFVRRSSSHGCDPIHHIDGWITRLFPFEKHEDRIERRTSLRDPMDLRWTPICAGSIDFDLKFPEAGRVRKFSVVSGIVGVGQDTSSHVLWPELGWAALENTGRRKPTRRFADE